MSAYFMCPSCGGDSLYADTLRCECGYAHSGEADALREKLAAATAENERLRAEIDRQGGWRDLVQRLRYTIAAVTTERDKTLESENRLWRENDRLRARLAGLRETCANFRRARTAYGQSGEALDWSDDGGDLYDAGLSVIRAALAADAEDRGAAYGGETRPAWMRKVADAEGGDKPGCHACNGTGWRRGDVMEGYRDVPCFVCNAKLTGSKQPGKGKP